MQSGDRSKHIKLEPGAKKEDITSSEDVQSTLTPAIKDEKPVKQEPGAKVEKKDKKGKDGKRKKQY